MQAPEGVEDYCTTYDDCVTHFPDVMSKWDTFFQVHVCIRTCMQNTHALEPCDNRCVISLLRGIVNVKNELSFLFAELLL